MFIKRLIGFLVSCVLLCTMFSFPITVHAATPKLVAFTFDDGPSVYTSDLLDGLKARKAKATFFVTGVNGGYSGAVHRPDMIRRIVAEGHQLANHTYSHYVPFDSLSGESIRSEVQGVAEHIYAVTGKPYRYLVRTPGGAVSNTVSENVGAPIILWDVDTLDWRYRDADSVYSRIISDVSDGSIVLLHDLYPTSIEGALAAIDTLKAEGYECVTVSELFRRRGKTLQDGEVYTAAYNRGKTLPAYKAPTISYTLSPVSGKARVSVSSREKGVTYRYTTTGKTPSVSNKAIGDYIDVDYGKTVKVVGFDAYGTRTPMASKLLKNAYEGAFDAKYYASKYPDLKKAYGNNASALLSHFLKHGLQEGRQASPIFSISYYMSAHPDLKRTYTSRKSLMNHFLTTGMKQGLRASKQFDPVSYRLRYKDLRNSYGNTWQLYYLHYIRCGQYEKRDASSCKTMIGYATKYNGVNYAAVYNYNDYVKRYPDVKAAYGYDDKAVLKHFVTFGMNETRRGSQSFDVQAYRKRYPDLKKAYGKQWKSYYLHYITHGKKEGRKGV